MKNFPNAFVIILCAIVAAWLLSFLVPAGQYQRIEDVESKRTVVVADSYRQVEVQVVSVLDFITAIPRGIAGRAETMVLILLLGGCFYVIEKTGALSQGLNRLVLLLHGRETLALVIVPLLFITGGVTIGLQEEVIALTPVLLIFCRNLGYDKLTIILASYGSSVVGSSFSPSNPFGVLIAQREAGVELLSGFEFRVGALLVATILWIAFIIYYGKRNRVEKEVPENAEEPFSSRSLIILGLVVATFLLVTYGLLVLDWGFNELSACFFALGIVAGLIGRLGLEGTTTHYIEGFKEMVFAAIIIGLANAISLLLKEGMIIDTIVYALFGPLQYLDTAVSALLMMVSHAVLHLPIPSYSGQAVLTMPILTPLSDLIGLSRQTCVLAYQYGAILMDMVIPTNGALMAVLAVAGVSYDRWLKFIWRPLLMLLILAAATILVAIWLGI